MSSLTLRLETVDGHGLGELPMPDVIHLKGGVPELRGHVRPADGVEKLLTRITGFLGENGVVPILDPVDLRIAVSRSLLTAKPDQSEIKVSIKVRPIEGAQPSRLTPPAPTATAPDDDLLKDLFDLDGLSDLEDLIEENVNG